MRNSLMTNYPTTQRSQNTEKQNTKKLKASAAIDFCENQMEFFGFLPQRLGLFLQFRHSRCNHPEKKLCFARFALADGNFVPEVLFGDRIVRFAIVGTHTGSCTDQLINQTIRYSADRHSFSKADNGFSKQSRALFKVIGLRSPFPNAVIVFLHSRFGLLWVFGFFELRP